MSEEKKYSTKEIMDEYDSLPEGRKRAVLSRAFSFLYAHPEKPRELCIATGMDYKETKKGHFIKIKS